MTIEKIILLLSTLRHLRLIQILYQIRYRIVKVRLKSDWEVVDGRRLHFEPFVAKRESMRGVRFTQLNIASTFTLWSDTRHGMLWAYNLNYMDWLLQEEIDFEAGAWWIDRFIEDLPTNNIGVDPYPIALRGINWIKFITSNWECIDRDRLARWNRSLYSQYQLLNDKLEYHLLGNHLLEDAYSLLFGAIYFSDERLFRRASKLLSAELKEQTLGDGAHYEQSPMYHSILLDRLLDCYNISSRNTLFNEQQELNTLLRSSAERMLGHLESIKYMDGSIPLLNDSANGVAPPPSELLDYAKRVGLSWSALPLRECGYRKLQNRRFESILDIGNIEAIYQPGHSHADTFSYELRIDGEPFIVDTAISTYEKNERRQYERSTAAHNTVSIDCRDSSRVWGGFRVAQRAQVVVQEDSDTRILARHNGFGKRVTHSRRFELHDESFVVMDKISTPRNAQNYIHFAPNVAILSYNKNYIETSRGSVQIEGGVKVEIRDCKVSTEYNRLIGSKVAIIDFVGAMQYTI